MKIVHFEDILLWQRARILSRRIYKILDTNKDFGFRNQIFRASVSIMNNVAEGYERLGDKEFKRFLYIAKGSVGEVRSLIYLGNDLNYINNDDFKVLLDDAIDIAKMLSAFIKRLN